MLPLLYLCVFFFLLFLSLKFLYNQLNLGRVACMLMSMGPSTRAWAAYQAQKEEKKIPPFLEAINCQ